MTSNIRSPALRWPGAAIGPGSVAPRLALGRFVPGIAATAGALLFVAPAALVLSQRGLSLRMAVACGVALLALLMVALVRYDTAVALGLVVFGVVRTEPALPDAVFGVVIAVGAVTGRFRLGAAPRTLRLLLGALVAVNLLSAIDVVNIGAGARFLAITVYLVVFGVWLAGYVDSRRRTRLVVRAYLVAAVSSALVGSLALFVSFPGSALLSGDGYRAKALFQDPNVFGPFLVPAAVILLEERMRPTVFARRPVLNFLCLLVLVAGIVFSYSRAAWLNLVTAVVVLTVLRGRGPGGARHVVRMAVAATLAAAVAAALIEVTGSTGFLEQRAHYQAYDSDRFSAQRMGVKLALEHPLGVGPGQYEEYAHYAAHSLYMRTLAEQGVLGLGVVLALVSATLALAARNAFRRHDLHGLSSLALFAAWCGMLVNSVFVDTLHWRHLWLLAALTWANAMLHRPDRVESVIDPAKIAVK